jgi:hypothetical protein
MAKDFFDRFIADCQQQLDSSGVELEKEIEKNLGSGSRTEN